MKGALLLVPAFLVASIAPAAADEGMWLFSAPPREAIRSTYGFRVNDAWLDQLMHSSVRFNSGGSGSFVGGGGLLLTNYHVALDALQKMSSPGKNLVRDGFYAATPADEVPCLDLEIDVLQSTEDVTPRVNAAMPPGAADGPSAAEARRRVIAGIEKESHDATGLRSDVVTLYHGGQYHLYRYKRYTDVRLVFAPEQQAALFGGDPDNYEFPRYALDVCIFRAYENGRAAHPADFLKWSASGPVTGELVFAAGNPGYTDRLVTVAQLATLRDLTYPLALKHMMRREALLEAWSGRGAENARRAKDALFLARNSRKVWEGILAGLRDPGLIGRRQKAESGFKRQLAGRPDGKEALAAFDSIAAAEAEKRRIALRLWMLETSWAFSSDSFTLARTLLRASDERQKPNGDRLPEFSEPRRDSLELGLFSEKPIYADMEILTLGDSLGELAQALGDDDPTVRKVLGGRSPLDRAAELVVGTKVRDGAYRRRLYESGATQLAAAHDPMVELARAVDAESRSLRRTNEAGKEIEQEAQAVIGRARFAVEGPGSYPDATYTLRLAYGTVRGYREDGAVMPPMTTLAGLFHHSDEHGGAEPYDLPPRWVAAKASLNLETPLNFVSDCDVIGGSSGSPTVNTRGEIVGVVFDGNIQSLSGDLAYDSAQARAISVDSAAILEALRKVYGAGALADELLSGHR